MKQQNYQTAILFALAATLTLSVINALTKLSNNEIDPFTFIFWRNLIALPPLLVWLKRIKQMPKFNRTELKAHFPRAFLGMTAYVCLIYSIQHMPLADVTAVSLSMPLFVAMFAPMLLGEKLHLNRTAFMVLGFVGVLIILRPDGKWPWYVAASAVLQPILLAFAMINLRHLSKTVSAPVIVFYFAFFSVVFTAPWALYHIPNLSLSLLSIVAAVGFLGILLQFMRTKALELAEASAITPFNYIELVWSTLLAIVFWHEWPDAWAWAGMALIVGMGLALNFLARPAKIPV